MSDIESTIQACLKTTQAMIDFLSKHQMSYWAEQFELIAKALQKPDADKAVTLHKKVPRDNIERLFGSMASKDPNISSDDEASLAKLIDDVTQAFSKLKSHVKGQTKKTNVTKAGLNRSHQKGGDFGATTRSRSGAQAPRRTSSS